MLLVPTQTLKEAKLPGLDLPPDDTPVLNGVSPFTLSSFHTNVS